MRSYNDVLSFVKEENIKFIKLAFIDAFGVPKNLAVIPEELERAFREGISFDASAVDGYDDGVKSDMFLNPDPDVLRCDKPRRNAVSEGYPIYSETGYPGGEGGRDLCVFRGGGGILPVPSG